ncbi:MAG TPA: serine/threonine-protein kinase, partial [Myxococcota bacterium]|nr:serine/threonine-protein kinase [Myxococcota bacterium]
MSEPRHSTSNPKSLVGTVIAGRYEVIKELGQGGMGVVLRAKQIAMNREVALKVLHPQFSQNRQAAARFHREMQVTSKLEHANTIRVYDFGETEDGQLYLAMELVPGKTLSELLGAQPVTSTTPRQDETDLVVRTGLPLPRLVHIARQIAVALKAAHGEGIVHRDLKPDNVMLIDRYGDKDTVKVLDFGIARFADESAESQRLTAEGAVVGTPAYMSPEQATGRPVGAATDIYAFGVMLFEMATGTIPFSAPTTVSLMVMHVQEPPPRPSTVAPVDPRLEQLILRCLAKDPADRPASAEEVIAALDQLVAPSASAPGRSTSGPPAGAPDTPPAKKSSKLPLLLALLVLVGIGVTLAVVLSQGGAGPGTPNPPEPIAVKTT